MSLWGKILAVSNALTAVAFVCLVALDWSKRQAWSYQVFRHELAIYGLPLQEDDEAWRLPESPVAQQLGEETLKDVFRQAGSDPVRTQMEEVERAQRNLLTEINGLPSDSEKRSKLKSVLLSLSRTGDERDELARRIADPAATLDGLLGLLRARFDEVLRGSDSAGPSPRDPAGQRQVIAHLLYNLNPDVAWHQRVMVVVGLVAYAREADSQAAAFQEMTRRARLAIDDERTAFEVEYQRVVQQRILALAAQVEQLASVLKDQKELKQKHDVLVKARKSDVAELTELIKKTQSNVQSALAEQNKLEKRLFEVQGFLGAAIETNLRLERDIRALELER